MAETAGALSYTIADGKLHVLGHTFDIRITPRFVRVCLTGDLSTMQLWGSSEGRHWRLLQEQPHVPAPLVFPRIP